MDNLNLYYECSDAIEEKAQVLGQMPLVALPKLGTEWSVCLAGVPGSPFWTQSLSRFNNRVRVQNLPGRPLVAGAVPLGAHGFETFKTPRRKASIIDRFPMSTNITSTDPIVLG